MEKICKIHGLTSFTKRSGRINLYRCKKCQIDAVHKWRKKTKLAAIEYKGGSCNNCGYNKCAEALEFHHLDISKKEFGISSGNTRSWEKIKIELDKCVLLCSNCHKETHVELDKGV